MSFASSKASRGMIFLEHHHPIVLETLLEKLQKGGKGDPCDITCSDFDDVRYRILIKKKDDGIVHFQLGMPYLKELLSYGAAQTIDSMYSSYTTSSTELGYDMCFKIDVNGLKEKPEAVAKKFSEIKQNLFAAPLEKAFKALESNNASSVKPMTVPFRTNEAISIVPSSDRVLVFFNVEFVNETDNAIAKIFLQEFSESQRKVPLAPAVTYTQDVPRDLSKVLPKKARAHSNGFIQFQMFKSHVEGARMATAIKMFTMFRSYLHYHIKASKAHLNARMRARVSSLLQVLKRAEPGKADPKGTKKAYRTY